MSNYNNEIEDFKKYLNQNKKNNEQINNILKEKVDDAQKENESEIGQLQQQVESEQSLQNEIQNAIQKVEDSTSYEEIRKNVANLIICYRKTKPTEKFTTWFKTNCKEAYQLYKIYRQSKKEEVKQEIHSFLEEYSENKKNEKNKNIKLETISDQEQGQIDVKVVEICSAENAFTPEKFNDLRSELKNSYRLHKTFLRHINNENENENLKRNYNKLLSMKEKKDIYINWLKQQSDEINFYNKQKYNQKLKTNKKNINNPQILSKQNINRATNTKHLQRF